MDEINKALAELLEELKAVRSELVEANEILDEIVKNI